MKKNKNFRGYLFAMTAAVLWAVSGASAKYLFTSGLTPFQVVQLRLTIATALLFFLILVFRPSLLKISSKDIYYFLVFGSVGMASVQFTYLYAISKINVAAAILIQYMAPALIAVYCIVFEKERVSRETIFSICTALGGCYLVVGAYNLDILSMNKAGIISGLLSAVGFAWYSVQGEYGMRKYNPWTVLFYALVVATIVWNIFYPPLESFRHEYTKVQWGWILYIAVLGTLMPFGLYLEGINLIRSTHASITATLEPITAGLLSYIFLGEMMDSLQLFGGLVVIASIIVLQFSRENFDKAPHIIRNTKEAECGSLQK